MTLLEGKYKEYFTTANTDAFLFKLITVILCFFILKKKKKQTEKNNQNYHFNNFFCLESYNLLKKNTGRNTEFSKFQVHYYLY